MSNLIYKNCRSKVAMLAVKAMVVLTLFTGCEDYLDIVPDNVATIDNAFTLRNEAEKYLFTLYAYLPDHGDGWYNAGMMAGDEIWLPLSIENPWHAAFRIALGQQNPTFPLYDEWTGRRKGNGDWSHLAMWDGINNCNIFIDNMLDPNNVGDMDSLEIEQWVAEAKVLKSYFHFHLMRMYGPIPIQKTTIPITITEPISSRQPIDSVVHYIGKWIDEAVPYLPREITNRTDDLGRLNKPIALAIKAKTLLYAASPLFNGDPDFADLTDKEGNNLFPTAPDPTKWEKARDAIKAAIDMAHSSDHYLYRYENDTRDLSDDTKKELNFRGAITTRWAPEHVWALSNSYFNNQFLCMPPTERSENTSRFNLWGQWAAPLRLAKLFYTKNGVPIEEDKTLDFGNPLEVRKATLVDRYKIEPNYETARLNFDREPRFYGSLGFDGGVWYMADGNDDGADENNFYIKCKNTQLAGYGFFQSWNETGYFIKKLVHYESSTNGQISWREYPWPEVRLADLYLMYAEALNEVSGGSAEARAYVDSVRIRAGLQGVETSWLTYSSNPAKYTSQNGLREIIHRERLIELAFEGHRFWDLRRWKKAADVINQPVKGLRITETTTAEYNVEREVYQQRFIAPRDYFWPIPIDELRKNPNLVQNKGW
ncbi:RagB/SusD family nutrient uptake outer membrane protein [Marinoscillum sp. MHG1-6]|uniref:RagB/SusD family nutrient uptake outer membrane protein n=1 Tax=Marinoscillum sp. MHG1-6 TaxID=2959627 RepID=UPI002157A776|nr:RagB/SusD family nutrient uptake outer membrane protein [Marinoscillum sp. MHG1-6]